MAELKVEEKRRQLALAEVRKAEKAELKARNRRERAEEREAARKLALRGSIHHRDVRDESNSMDMTDQVETELESITGVPPTDDSAESETSSSISQPTQVGIKRVMAHGWANLPTFQEFDEDETGSLDRFQFNKALKKMFSMNSAFLTRAELKHIAKYIIRIRAYMGDFPKKHLSALSREIPHICSNSIYYLFFI